MTPTAEQLVDSVSALLPLEPPPTEQQIDDTLSVIAAAMKAPDDIVVEARRILHASFKLRMELGTTLVDADDHEPWLVGRADGIDPYYWTRYRRLLGRKGWGRLVIDTLHRTTDEVLDLLGDPTDTDPWARRGLVVGDVQSGKTATYAALIAKAADAGYRMIILLTGTLENVRRQTQERMDESFVGLDSRELLTGTKTRRKVHVGVGTIDARRDGIVFTSQDHDFRKDAATSLNISLASVKEPVLVVTKKQKAVLGRLATWLRSKNADGSGHIDVPLLMIDDEADNASVNTKKKGEDPTTINAAIRDLLSIFTRSAYVGFTATPFANIFIDPRTTSEMLGNDLFPRHFIHVLEPPNNYVGMDGIFPHRDLDDEETPVSIRREIDDEDGWLPLTHRIESEPGDPPRSLMLALNAFLIAAAIRDLRARDEAPERGGNEHRTMLVNASRFTSVQNLVAEQLLQEVDQIRDAVRMHGKLEPERAEAQSPRIAELAAAYREEFSASGHAWKDILDILHDSLRDIRVRPVNQSTRKDKLDYGAVKGPPGVRAIVVGGNSLSRGLTLEGLTVSYFLRNSRAYDTLLQMGRWFGYRDGYGDLCRIWMSEEARGWYEHIAEATTELKADFARMKRRRATPMEFGLRVRTHPDTLLITARNKMRSAKEVNEVWEVSLTGRLVESTRLFADRGRNASNVQDLQKFISLLQSRRAAETSPHGGALLWTGVKADLVADLLYDGFAVHPFNFDFQGESIAAFLRQAVADGDELLSEWTIVLPTSGQARDDQENPIQIPLPAPLSGVAAVRSIKKSHESLLVSGKSSHLGGRSDLRHGFTQAEWLELNATTKPSESELRQRLQRPLLIMYFLHPREKGVGPSGTLLPAIALHFPGEEQIVVRGAERRVVGYQLNVIAQEQLLQQTFDDDDDEEELDLDGGGDDDAD
jgi:hypothetical protein